MWKRSLSNRTARQEAGGFTLVEILVVVVIIAVVTAGVLLSVSLTGRDHELEQESERLLALLQYAREQGEVQTREYGLLCTSTGYRFVRFDPRTDAWNAVDRDDALRSRALPEGLSLSLIVEARPVVLDRPADSKDYTPQLMIFSNGDLTPFELTLARRDEDRSITLASKDDGKIEARPMQERQT